MPNINDFSVQVPGQQFEQCIASNFLVGDKLYRARFMYHGSVRYAQSERNLPRHALMVVELPCGLLLFGSCFTIADHTQLPIYLLSRMMWAALEARVGRAGYGSGGDYIWVSGDACFRRMQ